MPSTDTDANDLIGWHHGWHWTMMQDVNTIHRCPQFMIWISIDIQLKPHDSEAAINITETTSHCRMFEKFHLF